MLYPPINSDSPSQNSGKFLTRLVHYTFALYLILNLITPSWRYGPFAWLPLARFAEWAGAPVKLGLFNLLPLLVIIGWGVQIWRSRQPGHPFINLGRRALSLPFFMFTLWGLLSLDPAPTRRTFLQGMGLGLAWLVYLYLINHRRDWSRPLLIITLCQSLVALGQFLSQKDLGLTLLGELPLNPAFTGVTVLSARGVHWLRAYGLTMHPNLLGSLLTVMLLLLLPAWQNQLRERPKGLMNLIFPLVIGLGLMGLFVSFSRSAWLAFLVGFVIWRISSILAARSSVLPANRANHSRFTIYTLAPYVFAFLLLALCLFLYGDLALSRLSNFDQPLEATSINERMAAIKLAQQVIMINWQRGVGLGNYADYAKGLDAAAFTVHNIPLLMLAELGVPGGLLWLWLILAPFYLVINRRVTLAQLAPWCAMLVIGLFDVTLWLTTHWQTAILFALLLAHLNTPVTSETPSPQ